MKDSKFSYLAIKTIIFSVFGLSTLPYLAVVLQYIDSVTGFSQGNGYYSDSSVYLAHAPLIYIKIVLYLNIVGGIAYLIYARLKNK